MYDRAQRQERISLCTLLNAAYCRDLARARIAKKLRIALGDVSVATASTERYSSDHSVC
jgi:hypothetical protein